MRTVTLYLAVSLDGYLADKNGGVDWLAGQEENPDAYESFLRQVDTIVMGWNTYRQIAEELSPERWIYEGLESYVITHRSLPASRGDIVFTDEAPCALVRRLRRRNGGKIWICGGADLARQLMEEDLIDEYDITVVPLLLGGGLRLFGQLPAPLPLKLKRFSPNGGMMELLYERQAPQGPGQRGQ